MNDKAPPHLCPHCGGLNPCQCLEALRWFRDSMYVELLENRSKGGFSAYREYGVGKALAEVFDHAAKLHVAARELDRRRKGDAPRPVPWMQQSLEVHVVEFAADTANCAMGVLLNLDLIVPVRP